MKRLAGVLVILLCLAVISSACVFTEANQSQAEKPNVLQSAQPSSTAPGQAVLEDGTPVKLRIGRTVSSADAHVGETVDFEVLEEVRVGEVLVIPKGGVAWATVTEAQSKRRLGRGGKLDMNIDAVRLIDGQKVAVRAVKEVKGGGHAGAMTGAIVATTIVFFPAAPLFLLMHGKDITIPKGTEITAYINGNVPLNLAKFQPEGTLQAAVTPGTTGQATLEISSAPIGAEIELDGRFTGNTPSSVGVTPGDHALVVTKAGYRRWQRKLRTTTGTIRVNAELQSDMAQAVSSTTVNPSTVASPLTSAHAVPQQTVNIADKREPPPSSNPLVVTQSSTSDTARETAPGQPEADSATAYLGVRGIQDLDGVQITEVAADSPAAKAGLAVNDLIREIDGKRVSTLQMLNAEVAKRRPGSTLKVSYRYRGTTMGMTATVTLAAQP
jgi:PDZ domain-containing protein/PEGA domain-containing protein